LRPAAATADAWQSDLELLEQTHQSMRAAIARLSASDLQKKPKSSKVTNLDLILGIASHDVYHAGQIQMLKRMATEIK
jgi:hypothetical protein